MTKELNESELASIAGGSGKTYHLVCRNQYDHKAPDFDKTFTETNELANKYKELIAKGYVCNINQIL